MCGLFVGLSEHRRSEAQAANITVIGDDEPIDVRVLLLGVDLKATICREEDAAELTIASLLHGNPAIEGEGILASFRHC